MNLHDVGTLIWAIVVIIAVISSLMRSARRAMNRPSSTTQATQRPAPARQVFAPPTPSPVAATPRVVIPSAASRIETPPPAAAAPIRFTPRTQPSVLIPGEAGKASGVEIPPPVVVPSVGSRASGADGLAMLFANRSPIVNGIIALEVLGPPRALRGWTSIV